MKVKTVFKIISRAIANPFPYLTVGALLFMGCAALLIEVPDITGERLTGRLAQDIATLASDEFQGRKPGTPGGKKTVEYIERRFREIGLEPGNGDSYLQEVPLHESAPSENSNLNFIGLHGDASPAYGQDFFARIAGRAEAMALDSAEVIFVGYGATAPEYDWDDYAGLDVTGRVVVMLRNDPGYASGDSTFFNGAGDTRHAGTSHKFSNAGKRGAAAVFIILDSTLVGAQYTKYNWAFYKRYVDVVIDKEESGNHEVHAVGMLSVDFGRSLLAQSGYDYDSLVVAATKRDFQAFELPLSAHGLIQSRQRRFVSQNVMGLVRGSKRPDELLIYMAHWDHEGIDTTLEGDQIFNGAVDNATGTAAVISLAEQFAALDQPPQRSIMFLAFTAEEMGLLGSRWFTENPVFPLTKTVAAINIDMIYPYSEPRDLEVFGLGKSQLDGYLRRAAAKLGMVVEEDRRPDESFYFRSDHINLARKGVPALFMTNGVDDIQHGREWGLEQVRTYDDSLYHTVDDEFDESWNFNGLENFVQIVFDVGYTIGNQSKFPNWKRGDDFRTIRDEAMKAARATETVSTE